MCRVRLEYGMEYDPVTFRHYKTRKEFQNCDKIPIGVEEFGRKLLLKSPLNSEAVTFSRDIFYSSNLSDNENWKLYL